MKEYNGEGLTPLFYSEISSSYMLYDIFNSNKEIIAELIKVSFNLNAENIHIDRERNYSKKGSIDVFVEFKNAGKKCALLLEVKVHDYISATAEQISTYYNAAIEENTYDEVFFIYLTQFTENNDFTGIAAPKTIYEAKKGRALINEKFKHISWEQLHIFLDKYYDVLSDEQKLIVTLNRQWIMQQCKAELENNRIDVGTRGLEHYFPDMDIDVAVSLPFGRNVWENNRHIFRIDLTELDENQLNAVFDVISKLALSKSVNKIKQYITEESTIQGAKSFLMQLAQGVEEWILLSFYSKLFLLPQKVSYLKFNGTGVRGFSIKLEIKGKGEISLCTIYVNKTIDFSLMR